MPDYKDYCRAAEEIQKSISDFQPEIGVILSSDMMSFEQKIEKPIIFRKDIPEFLFFSMGGEKRKLIFGYIGEKKIVCLTGRYHFYEGYDADELSFPVRVLKLLGIKKLIVANIAGAINTDYHVGDVMIMKDHINMMGLSALRGRNIDEFGPRFPDMVHAYNRDMIRVAETCAENTPLTIRKGVYFFFPGPQFETPAEIRAARILGGDAAGMSTVNEIQTAAHCGLPVLGLSLISNMAAGILDTPVTVDDVNKALSQFEPMFADYVASIIERF